MTKKHYLSRAFTLIELLVVISIMGILLALSVFGMQEARRASRDGKRKADIEQIRSALEMYKSDCNVYPEILDGSIAGTIPLCSSTNTYLSPVPQDPISGSYGYIRTTETTYTLTATLEQGGSYQTTNP